MCAELEKINFDKNFNFFTVGKNHIVIEKTEENVFEVSKAPLWKLEDIYIVDYITAENSDELHQKMLPIIEKYKK